MSFVLIDTIEKLLEVCKSINAEVIAVDTEFLRTKNNEPILCLIQIAFGNFRYIIDALAIEDLSAISQILSNENIKKVFHACKQDIEVLASYDVFVENIFDTQVAEMFLSSEKIANYETLVKKYMNKKLHKLYTTSNWQKRPLSDGQLNYAINDVIYLCDIYEKQVTQLNSLCRDSWLDEEFRNMLNECIANNNYDNFDTTNFTEDGIQILNDMLNWRKSEALKLNVSPTNLIRNDILISIIKNGKLRLSQMRKSRLYEGKIYKEFIKFVEHSEFMKKKLYIHNSKTTPNSVVKFLKVAIDVIAKEKNMNSDLIATKEILEDFIGSKESSIVLKTWRKNVCGDVLLNLCNGKSSIKLENDILRICYE